MIAILPGQEKTSPNNASTKTALILHPELGKTPPNKKSNTNLYDKSNDQPLSTGTDALPQAEEAPPSNRQQEESGHE